MKTSEAGLRFIMAHEGVRYAAYPDPATGGKPWTIGVGRAHGVREGDTCTDLEAQHWLAEDCKMAEGCIDDHVDIDLTQAQFDALVSLIFNIGCGNFRSSTLLRLLNAGDYEGAKKQFSRWDRAAGQVMAGLSKRRADEAELFA